MALVLVFDCRDVVGRPRPTAYEGAGASEDSHGDDRCHIIYAVEVATQSCRSDHERAHDYSQEYCVADAIVEISYCVADAIVESSQSDESAIWLFIH